MEVMFTLEARWEYRYNCQQMTTIIALKASRRDCTNNNELLHKIGVLQCYAMQLFLITG